MSVYRQPSNAHLCDSSVLSQLVEVEIGQLSQILIVDVVHIRRLQKIVVEIIVKRIRICKNRLVYYGC